jgi:hypothetical protein
MMRRALLVSILGFACSPAPAPGGPGAIVVSIPDAAPPPPEPPPAPIAVTDAGASPSGGGPTEIEKALQEWSKKTQCADYDYFPEGGLQNLWCHRPDRVTVAALHALAGVEIFSSGPHKNDTLDLESDSFGHYNPAFVKWLVDHAVSERGSVGQKATQSAYVANLRPIAQIFWKTYEKSTRDKECFEREKRSYAAAIAKKKSKGFVERWFYFMNPYFCRKDSSKDNFSFYSDNGFDAGVDGNVTKTVFGFWLRRSMDGTMDAFAEGLKKLLASYEPELIEKPTKYADGDAITKALDAGVKSASATCKNPTSKSTTAAVNLVVGADGKIKASLAFVKLKGTAQERCVAAAFAAQTVPTFDGHDLHFGRTITVR